MSKSPIDFLLPILDECDYLTSHDFKHITLKLFHDDETLKRATVKSLEIIGEATKNLPEAFRKNYPDNMAGMRDRLLRIKLKLLLK